MLQIWRRSAQKRFADSHLLKRLSPNQSLFKGILKVLVLSGAFGCLSLALVNPKIGTKLETVRSQGVDIVFAVDVSKSMLAEDIAPNRLEKSKQLVTQIINSLASDRVGIIAYAGKAFPQLPITTDYASAKMFLQNMNTDMLSSQGTAIHEAIQLAKTYYDDEEQTNRILIIISDGEDHEGEAVDIAEEAMKTFNQREIERKALERRKRMGAKYVTDMFDLPADYDPEKDDTAAMLDLFVNDPYREDRTKRTLPTPLGIGLNLLEGPLKAGAKKTRSFFADPNYKGLFGKDKKINTDSII